MKTELLSCPFCGAGAFEIRPNGRMWLGMKYSEPASVSVLHWCEATPGQPIRVIERVGRDEASAIEAWNRRAQPAQAGQAPKDMKLVGYYHKAPSGDPHEDDFFFADAINGDCPHCHPCYMDASVVVHPTPAAWKTPMTEADLERITRDPITVREAVRAAERHHGIVGEKGGAT